MPSVFFVVGDNALEKERHIKALLARHAAGGGRASLDVSRADELTPETVRDSFSALSLFGGGDVRLVRGSEDLDTETLAELAGIISRPVPGLILILEGRRIGTRVSPDHPFHQALKKHAANVEEEEFKNPPPYQMPEWIASQSLARYKRPIDREAAVLLQALAGDDPMTLVMEMEKLDLLLPPAGRVTETDVKNITGLTRARDAWDLPPLVAQKNIPASVTLLHNLFEFNQKSVQVLYQLSDHFLRLFALKSHFSARPDLEKEVRNLLAMKARGKDRLNPLVAGALNEIRFSKRKISPGQVYPMFVLPDVMRQIGNFTPGQFQYVIRLIATYDLNLKSGLIKDSVGSMERLVYGIVLCDKFTVETRF